MRTAIAAIALLACACAHAPEGARELRLGGASMGTTWSVRAVAEGAVELAALEARLASVLERIDGRMSTWKRDSELARFDASRSTDWHAVSEETRFVVSEALRYGALTGGALDVTVSPLVELWGFGPAGRRDEPPSSEAIAAARAHTGLAKLAARAEPPALRKLDPELALDLSAIAKGYAVDALARELDARGFERYLVELGGELRARGTRTDGRPWRVALERVGGERPLAIELADRAVATSGDAHSAFEFAGHHYAHVIDPRTGAPAESGVASVTVVTASAMEADALATALMMLGPERADALAREFGFAFHMDLRRDDALVERSNAAFDALVAEAAP